MTPKEMLKYHKDEGITAIQVVMGGRVVWLTPTQYAYMKCCTGQIVAFEDKNEND